jgi:hypothetical protein
LLSGGGFEGMLNLFPNASLGLSLDKLDKNYTGFCIKVRRSSDNNELDIGFVNNQLDTASLLTFVGSGNGFINIWYDQSGNVNNATQTVASRQPRIVNNGEMVTDNAKPAILFPNDLSGNLNFNEINQTTILSVARILQYSLLNYILFNESANRGVFYGGSSGPVVNGLGIFEGSVKSITGESLESKIGYFNYNGSNYDVAENGNTSNALANGANFPLNGISRVNTSVSFRGKMQEIILYTSEQSANKVAMENNINARYNIY